MDNPVLRQIIFYAFGFFYLLCLLVAGYALVYFSLQ